MLIQSQQLVHTSVMSLQTGVQIATVKRVLIDPRDLTVVAYELAGRMLNESPSFLRTEDVREFGTLGFIVDSSDEFVGLDDVLRIRKVYDFEFDLIGLEVVEQKGTKLGKVQSYTTDAGSYSIQQIFVKQPFLKSIMETELIIHRSQIVEVSGSRILVRTTAHKEDAALPSSLKAYRNPFRSSQPAGSDSTI